MSALADPAVCRDRALKQVGNLPPFSPILSRLMATLASEDVSFAEIAQLIEKDTVLAGNVLRTVNSALYGRRGTISSVGHAVSLMGLNKLRNTVMSLSVSRIWNGVKTPEGWPSARFNQHGVASAVLTDILALRARTDFPEGAFVAGLLHEIGFLLLGIANPEAFQKIRELHLAECLPLEECERLLLNSDHADLSAAALHKWNLPEPIRNAVRYQFEPQTRTGEEFPLSWLLHAAERLLRVREITVFELSKPPEIDPASVLRPFGLEDSWDNLIDEFEREFEPIRAFF